MITSDERPTTPHRVSVLVGLLGSLVIAAGSLATGRLAHTPLAAPLVALQRAPSVRPTGQVLLFVGILILCGAWWALGRSTRGCRDGPRVITGVAFVWSAPLILVPAGL